MRFGTKDGLKFQKWKKLEKSALLRQILFSEFRHLVARNSTIDFAKAKQLNNLRSGVKKKIASVEAKIMPNIIA